MRIACLLLALALEAFGQSGHVCITEFGRRVLSQSDEIVEARVAKLQPPFRGVSTARLDVKERLVGYERSKTLVLLFIDDYVAPDAFTSTLDSATVRYERERLAGLDKYLGDVAKLKLPRAEERATGARESESGRQESSAPGRGTVGVRLGEGEEGLFFLRRQGTSYSLIGLIPRRDPLYDVKRARMRELLALEAIIAIDVRAANAKRLFLDGIATDDPWLRGNSARELAALASRYPHLFAPEDAQLLAARLAREQEPGIRSSLERAASAVDPHLALRYAREAEEAGRTRHRESLEQERSLLVATKLPELRAADLLRIARSYGRGATGLLASFLGDPDAIVREYAAHGLAEHGGPSANGALREALGRERDREAAMAMIYALGVHADAEAVRVLAARLKEPVFERAAVHALARVGTPAARKALESHARSASGEIADLIATLLREEFAERS
jgi:hypothetical protein